MTTRCLSTVCPAREATAARVPRPAFFFFVGCGLRAQGRGQGCPARQLPVTGAQPPLVARVGRLPPPLRGRRGGQGAGYRQQRSRAAARYGAAVTSAGPGSMTEANADSRTSRSPQPAS